MQKEQLEYFVQLTHCKTLAEAAERTGLPEAKIGVLIAELEEELGCTLFNRKAKGLELTGYGRVLLDRSPHVILELRRLDEALGEERKRQALSIHFGIFTTTHCFVLMPQIAAGLTDLLFTVSVQPSKSLATDLENSHVHIAVMPAGTVPDGYESIPLYEETAYLSVPYTSKLADKDKLALADIATEPIYLVADLYGTSQWYEEIYRAAGGDLARAQRPDTGEYLQNEATTPRNHLSTSLMQIMGTSDADRIEIPIDDPVARREIRLVYKKNPSAELARVVDFVQENKEKFYTPRAFLPYFMHPANSLKNLEYVDVHQ